MALLVDGDNLTHDLAARVLAAAGRHGDPQIRRVYGNMANLTGWQGACEFRQVHAGTGKNAADLLFAVQAMDLMLRGAADVLVLATSDGDFSHLATHLREAGHVVVGLGEAKAPEGFRKSCSRFEVVTLGHKAGPTKDAAPNPSATEAQIAKLIGRLPAGMKVTALSEAMRNGHGFKISDQPQKTWRAWLKARPDPFVYEANDGKPMVRLARAP